MKNYILLLIVFLIYGCNNSKKKTLAALNMKEHTCWASVSFQHDNVYVSYISNSKSECNLGKGEIVLEKSVGQNDNGKALFEKLDAINVEKQKKEITFSKVLLKLNKEVKEQEYIVEFYDEREEKITRIFNVWKIDFKTMKFIKITVPENLKFKNPDWIE